MGVGQPALEGELGALHRQAQHQQQHGQGQRQRRPPGGGERPHRVLQGRKEQVAGDGVEDGHTQQKHPRAQGAEHEIADGGGDGGSGALGRHRGAGGDGADLQKDVGGEDVIGVNEGQHGGEQQAQRQVKPPLALVGDIPGAVLPSPQHRQEHHPGEDQGQRRLQSAGAQLVAPGGRKVPHLIDEALPLPPAPPPAAGRTGPSLPPGSGRSAAGRSGAAAPPGGAPRPPPWPGRC